MSIEYKEARLSYYGVRHMRNKVRIYFGAYKFSGSIEFYPKNAEVPQSIVTSKDPFRFALHWESDRYPEVIGTLRHENNVRVMVSWDTNNNSIVDYYMDAGSAIFPDTD